MRMKAFLAALALVCLVASAYAEEQAAKPDLEIVSVRTLPEQIPAGSEFIIEYVVRNNGPGTFEGQIVVKTTIGNMTRAQAWSATLQPGENITTRQPWTQGLYIAGEYDITVTVDPRNDVDESDEGNNEVSSAGPTTGIRMSINSSVQSTDQGTSFNSASYAPEASSGQVSEASGSQAPAQNTAATRISRVVVITEYESGDVETRVYGGNYTAVQGDNTAAATNNMPMVAMAVVACVMILAFYLMKKRPSASADLEPELKKLQREKEEIEKVIEMAKVKYYKRAIDEASYREIITENQQRLMHIEARMGALENRVDKIEKKLE